MDTPFSETAELAPAIEHPTPEDAVETSGLSMNNAAALSYFFMLPAIYFLVIRPYSSSPFVRFHSIQSVLFGLGAFGAQSLLFYLVPGGLKISMFLSVAFFVLWIVAVMKAMKGEWFKLPVIGYFALANSRH